MKRFSLESVAFLSGAAGMILELDGSRVLAPYLGTTIVVWSSLIGIILGSLSLGYWAGGMLADRAATPKRLGFLLLCAALLVALIPYLQEPLLTGLTGAFASLQARSVLACLVLFAPANLLLGMVSPTVVKIKMEDLRFSGRTVGNLYAFSTLGSIVGTFLAGFVLIEYFRTTSVLFLVAGVLLLASAVAALRPKMKAAQAAALLFVAASLGLFRAQDYVNARANFIDVDSQYSRIWVYSGTDAATGRPARFMRIGDESSSAMYLDGSDLVYPYTKYYRLGAYFNPNIRNGRGLMLGGAAYSYPKDFLASYPAASMDVVEIDPEVTDLARRYFKLPATPRLNVIAQDGRTYLNESDEKYDVIYGDAFRSFSVPYQLTTKEAAQHMSDMLNPGGAVLLNVISSMDGDRGKFLQAEYATYASVFPQVYAFPVTSKDDGGLVQNIMIVALKSPAKPSFASPDPELKGYLGHLWTRPVERGVPVLTDEYAPVDRYMLGVLN